MIIERRVCVVVAYRGAGWLVGKHKNKILNTGKDFIMTNVTIIGRLVANAKTGETRNGNFFANFTIADSVTDDTVYFHTVVMFGKPAEIVAKYCEKGTQVAVNGILTVREYETRDGEKRKVTEILGNSIKLLGSSAEKKKRSLTRDDDDDENPFDDEDVEPFNPKKETRKHYEARVKKAKAEQGTSKKTSKKSTKKQVEDEDEDDYDYDDIPF